MDFPIMLKVADQDDGVEYYTPLNTAIFTFDKDKVIRRGFDSMADQFNYLISTDDKRMALANLNCSSYEELLVKFQLNNLLHGNIEHLDISNLQNSILEKENAKLKQENAKLKAKLDKLKKMFKEL